MTEQEMQVFLDEFDREAQKAAADPSLRVCAICLCATPRETYGEHMQGHGYETVNVRFADQ